MPQRSLNDRKATLTRVRSWRERLFSWPWRPWVKEVVISRGRLKLHSAGWSSDGGWSLVITADPETPDA